ncbi:hypothetical protein [Aquicella lusitana]|uniref:hypothetical protein n=1 Tax=Aquicella lusitana TaxID=254246 RepID=UPI0011C0547E|nr:hypothetical protein [Aquicella lusitana]
MKSSYALFNKVLFGCDCIIVFYLLAAKSHLSSPPQLPPLALILPSCIYATILHFPSVIPQQVRGDSGMGAGMVTVVSAGKWW